MTSIRSRIGVVFFCSLRDDLRVMITSFPKRAMFNPGGLTAFYFIPSYSIIGIPDTYNGRVMSSIKTNDGENFYKGYATLDTLKYSEKPTKTENGTYYTQQLTGYYPGDDPNVQALFQEMERPGHSYLVVFEDMLGKRRLAGLGSKLDFTANYDSENKRYAFTFSGDTLEKAPLYPFALIY